MGGVRGEKHWCVKGLSDERGDERETEMCAEFCLSQTVLKAGTIDEAQGQKFYRSYDPKNAKQLTIILWNQGE